MLFILVSSEVQVKALCFLVYESYIIIIIIWMNQSLLSNWDMVKKYKYPVIDYKFLDHLNLSCNQFLSDNEFYFTPESLF